MRTGSSYSGFGDLIRAEAARRGLDSGRLTLQDLGAELIEQLGPAGVTERLLELATTDDVVLTASDILQCCSSSRIGMNSTLSASTCTPMRATSTSDGRRGALVRQTEALASAHATEQELVLIATAPA